LMIKVIHDHDYVIHDHDHDYVKFALQIRQLRAAVMVFPETNGRC